MTDTTANVAKSTFVERANIGFWEFIAMSAAIGAIVAMAMDVMLPVLPQMGQDLAVSDVNQRQLVIVAFTLGLGVSQIVFGPLSDRFGRRGLLIGGLAVFVAMSVACAFVTDFKLFLILRAIQGAGAASANIVMRAVIRDCFSGAALGRVMSFIFTAFMTVPIIAPLLGQGVAVYGNWRMIFIALGLISFGILIWLALRLKETMAPEDRRSLAFGTLWEATKEICTNRVAVGYTLAATITQIALFAYLVSVQQVYGELYGLGGWFPLAFAASSTGIAIASIVNGKLVVGHGLRRMAHITLSAFALFGMILFLVSLTGQPPFWLTFSLISLCMAAFGSMQGNFGALSMDPLGHVAGIASSLIGVFTTTVGVIFGGLIGQAYNGTIIPLAFAFGASGAVSLAIIYWTEKGKLFARG